jgi:peptidyl-prolyl cis-trans isomerase SurA
MRLTTTLCLSAATLALAALCASAQPVRTAAAQAAVPVAPPATPPAAAFSPAPAATPAPAAPSTAAPAASPAPPATVASVAPAIDAVPHSNSDGIAATVGDNSVSDYELDQRLRLFFATAGFKPSAEDIKRARKLQLENLIDEHIQMAEARRRKVTVSRVEVDKELETIAKRQGITVKQMADELAKAGSDIEVLRTQTIASMAWRKVLYSEFSDQVVSTPAMVDDALRRAAEGANKTHYHVMEIFLPVDNPDKDAEVEKQMEEIETKIRGQQAPFRNLAQQYSRNPSAAAGGDMGWVYDGQLDPVLNAALKTMNINEISKPIRAKGGWYLLGLPERQEPLGTNVAAMTPEIVVGPTTVLPLARLLLPMPASTPPDVAQNLLRNAEQIRAAAVSCDTLEKISQDPQLKGSVFMKLGDMKVGDLSEQMQKALMATKGGEAAAPFQDEAGIEVIVRCDKRAPPPRSVFAMPTREEIENQLFTEQISAMARRYMRDLRRDANIQQRDDNAVLDAALIQ